MILSNIYNRPEPIETTPRVPFNQLRYGDRFKHSPNSEVHVVFRTGADSITVKRADGWIVTRTPDMEIWNKQVIKIQK